jgi:N-acetylmuramoyl-L-alanine amidase
MGSRHVVVAGECLSVIAERYGFRWQTLWDAPENADLRKARKSPSILYVNDVVFIPDKLPKSVSVPTGQEHKVVLSKSKTLVRLRFQLNGSPISNEPFKANLDSVSDIVEGKSDAQGVVEFDVPVQTNLVTVEFPQRKLTRRFKLGHLDPVDTPSGAQARLKQLGYYHGDVDGIAGELTRAATLAFQSAKGLAASGELDGPTQSALEAAYGS